MRYWYLQNWECSAASFHMIFLHSGIFVDFFAIFTCHALVGYRTQLNSFLSNVAFNGLANGTDLNSVCAVNCEIYVKNIQIYIHTWPKPVFHRLLDFGFAPSARSLRLKNFMWIMFPAIYWFSSKLLTWKTGLFFLLFPFPLPFALTQSEFVRWGPVAKPTIILFVRPKKTSLLWNAICMC